MNKIIITIVISFLGIVSFAQERFYNLYDGWHIGGIYSSVDYYITLGVDMHPTTDSNIPQYNLISFDGTLYDSFNYLNDSIDGISGMGGGKSYIITGEKAVFAESLVDFYKSYTLSPVLLFYDFINNNVDSILTYAHCTNSESMFHSLDTINNGYVISGNYRYHMDNYFPMMILTDNTGDTLSVKTYDFLPTNAIRRMVAPYQLLKLPDGGFLMSCQDEIGYYNYHGEVQRTCFLRLDSQGDELWRRYTTTQDTITVHPFAALMPDGDYLIAWSDPWLRDAQNPDKTLWLARMTDAGVIYGKKKVSDDIAEFGSYGYYINDYYQDETGNVYFAGERTGLPYPAFLLKVNSEGIAQWYREYECFPENDAYMSFSKIYGLTPTADGGFIMGGEYLSDPSTMFPTGVQQGLVIKVDSMGCLEEGCGTTNIRHTINALNAEIYPNPASEKITITLAKQTNNAHLKIYDAKGCLWINIDSQGVTQSHTLTNTQTDIEMDVSQLPVGIYTVNIWAEGKFYVGKFVKE